MQGGVGEINVIPTSNIEYFISIFSETIANFSTVMNFSYLIHRFVY